MKTVYEVSEPTQFPPFWNEEWLRAAIQELDKRAFTPEQRLSYEMTISANAVAIRNEQKKIKEAIDIKNIETVTMAFKRGKLNVEDSRVSVDFVLRIQRELAKISRVMYGPQNVPRFTWPDTPGQRPSR